jgi:hypothetical protein
MKGLPAYLVAAAFVLGGCSGGGGDAKSSQMTSSLLDPTIEAAASGLVGPKIPGDDTSADGGAPGTFLCNDTAGIEAYCADQNVTPEPGHKFHVVCINDFAYYPPVVTPQQGDVVAWVDVEKCADPAGGPVNVVEGLFANVIGGGCDTHHEVVTTPDETSFDPADTLNARLCSRFPSIPAEPGTPAIPNLAIDPGSCPGHPDETGNMTPIIGSLSPATDGVVTPTNVFCHKFVNVGAQHYTCFTNPAHTVVLHGGILVLPNGAPSLPDLPQQPQL